MKNCSVSVPLLLRQQLLQPLLQHLLQQHQQLLLQQESQLLLLPIGR